jgi:L-amino acid N-acyltransferase YncA
MSENTIQVSKISAFDELVGKLPGRSLSLFFDPFLYHEIKEALESGGEVFISKDSSSGETNGLFIYDSYEATGTIFTKFKEVFDHFYKLKPSSYIFSELDVKELPEKEIWNIWKLDVNKATLNNHRFKHHVSMDNNVSELEHFMAMTQPETNKKWVDVALKNGDKCFVVKIDENRIVGIAWMEIVDGFARSHGLYVEPQFRRKGIMRDNFAARLVYLKSRRVHTLINEIAESNIASSEHAKKVGEKIVGKIFLYTTGP